MSLERRPIILSYGEMVPTARNIFDRLSRQDQRFMFLEMERTPFANGERKLRVPETIRHHDIYLCTSLFYPDPNTALIELMLAIDAISRASAHAITLVLPFIPYTRQDRKEEPRVPISASVVVNMLQMNRAVRHVITMDMHSEQLQGVFEIPVDNLYGAEVHAPYFQSLYPKNPCDQLVAVSPDVGGGPRTRNFAKKIHPDLEVGMFDKRRTGPNRVEHYRYIGDESRVKDSVAILYDDMIDTAGSIVSAGKRLFDMGAREVCACTTFGIFSQKGTTAEEKLRDSGIKVVIMGAIPRAQEYYEKNAGWLSVIPIDELFAEAILEAVTVGGSISGIATRKKGGSRESR